MPRLSLLASAALSALVALPLALPAQAQWWNPEPEFEYSGVTHTVYWLGATWFPILTHVSEGDRIAFENLTGYTLDVEATDGDWDVENIYGYNTKTLDVTEGLTTSFNGYSRSYYSSRAYMSYGSLDADVDYEYSDDDLLQPD